MSGKVMLCGLPPTFDPVLQQIKLLGSYTVHGNYFTCCKTNLSRAVKRATRKSGLVAKSITTLYFLQQLFANCNKLICCKTCLIRQG